MYKIDIVKNIISLVNQLNTRNSNVNNFSLEEVYLKKKKVQI